MIDQPLRDLVKKLIIPTLLLVGIFLTPVVLYWGARPVTLAKSDAFSGRISQALAVSGVSNSVPKVGVDYTIAETTYFDNKQWVIIKLAPVGKSSINGIFVLQKNGDEYDVRLGPGSYFSSTMTISLPSDVQQKLNNEGYVYAN